MTTLSRCFWFQTIGAVLALAPSVIYLSWYLLFTDDTDFVTPYLQYVFVAGSFMMAGYVLLRKGMREEETKRIKGLIREVLEEKT